MTTTQKTTDFKKISFKLLALTFAVILVLSASITGCGKKPIEEETTEPTTETTTEATTEAPTTEATTVAPTTAVPTTAKKKPVNKPATTTKAAPKQPVNNGGNGNISHDDAAKIAALPEGWKNPANGPVMDLDMNLANYNRDKHRMEQYRLHKDEIKERTLSNGYVSKYFEAVDMKGKPTEFCLCPRCGKPKGHGSCGTCTELLRDMNCGRCGLPVKAMSCHSCPNT
ncbi:MAG: hypothetical protein RR229_08215 [Oscillospiraceae bacterium]